MQQRYILNTEGIPVPESDLGAWMKWCETNDTIVKREPVGGYLVSTAFTGLNEPPDEIPPTVWESIIFDGDREEVAKDRCGGTREQAKAMHQQMVAKANQLSQAAKG